MVGNFVYILVALSCGALPLSVWVGQVALKVDIRQYGDHNPGAANVYKTGGKRWGAVAVILDYLKGALPVALAHFYLDTGGWLLVAIALAPILGHAFSPFLRFRGGKALAVSFGVWTGLTLWQVPVLLGILFAVWLLVLSPEGWAVMAGMLCLTVILLVLQPDFEWIAVAVGNTIILAWTHRYDLAGVPRLKMRSHGA